MSVAHVARRLAAFALLLCAMASASLVAQQPYKIIDRWKLGGDGGWDYVTAEPGAHRLYITRGTHVDAIDTQTGKQTGTITGLHGVHGVALDDSGKFGYISDGGGNAIVVFDRSNLKIVATVPTGGQGPDAIIFEPATKTVWAFEGHSKDAAVLDTTTRKIVATIALPGKPEFPAVDGKGILFDNIEDRNQIVRLDAHTLKLTNTWPVTGCDGPGGLAIDAPGKRLFASCDEKKMAVVDTGSGKLLATAAIGDGPDAAIFSAARKLAFASCGEGVLSVVDAASPDYKTIQTLATQRGARTMAYDDVADRVYLITADFGPAPAATAANPRPRPAILPGSFTVIVVGR
jgi:DNA-binding beta-propeller fold protein YncE